MSSSRSKKFNACKGREMLKENRINELPDDILVNVISFLTLKEAGRTSVLSSKWRHLWTFIPILCFDACKIIDELWLRIKSLEVEEPKYFNWIDQVISSHKAPTIDEFRVQFDADLNESTRNRIDNWLEFAIQKRVKRLEINFSLYYGAVRPLCMRYTFPTMSCNSLTSLVLASVQITGEILENFLCSCLALEYLSVQSSESLVQLKVSGPLLNLKGLTISHCFKIKHLEISAPNLASVCYAGPKINVQFCTPKLVEVSIGNSYANDLVHSFSDLSSYLSQIEVLALSPKYSITEIRMCCDPVFSRLRKLDLSLREYSHDLRFFGSLLKACPFLQHFKLRLIHRDRESMGPTISEVCYHGQLKIVEIVGFVGLDLDIAIASFLLESAVSLEMMIIDPAEIVITRRPHEFEEIEEEKQARIRAKQFQENHKSGTVLIEIL